MPRNQVAPLQMPNLPGYNNSNTAKAKPKSSGFQMVNGIRMNKQEDHNTNGAQDALTHREADASFATEGSKVGSMTSREEVQNANPDKVSVCCGISCIYFVVSTHFAYESFFARCTASSLTTRKA